jgi:hypothetical protein
MNSANANALDYLADLSANGFWGTVSLKFENGQIVHVRQEENLKPSELSGKPRRSNGTITN